MAMATDPQLTAGVLNVPGGPIIEIARLSPGFRDQVGTELEHRAPSLYNGPSGWPPRRSRSRRPSTPIRRSRTRPLGAIVIQQAMARYNWIERLEAQRRSPHCSSRTERRCCTSSRSAIKRSRTRRARPSMRGGGLQGVTTYYRNDQTPTKDCNPHGFLIDPRLTGRQLGQMQVAAFLASGGTTINDPDGATAGVRDADRGSGPTRAPELLEPATSAAADLRLTSIRRPPERSGSVIGGLGELRRALHQVEHDRDRTPGASRRRRRAGSPARARRRASTWREST